MNDTWAYLAAFHLPSSPRSAVVSVSGWPCGGAAVPPKGCTALLSCMGGGGDGGLPQSTAPSIRHRRSSHRTTRPVPSPLASAEAPAPSPPSRGRVPTLLPVPSFTGPLHQDLAQQFLFCLISSTLSSRLLGQPTCHSLFYAERQVYAEEKENNCNWRIEDKLG